MISQVAPNLWRGPRPTDLRDLIAQHFEVIIDLQSGAEDLLTDSLYEQQRRQLTTAIMLFLIPCGDILPPSTEGVLRFLSIMSLNSLKTYIHCHSGVDRTGYMCAVFRMRKQGWSLTDAHEEFVTLGRHWWFFWWKWSLRKWELK